MYNLVPSTVHPCLAGVALDSTIRFVSLRCSCWVARDVCSAIKSKVIARNKFLLNRPTKTPRLHPSLC